MILQDFDGLFNLIFAFVEILFTFSILIEEYHLYDIIQVVFLSPIINYFEGNPLR